ncbi:hypothetical protein ZOSMA_84G00470 [Zostera marina]|uniref:Uncharacterized protein n=1 Tax=Zostera marina TaxID=29655 RepID=A0A0K9NLH8_ZOSMR|nr:hypothetical protein ZOSMA_84G00470 [Zostera marina]
MRARLLVFPIKGRNWCFSRSVDKTTIPTTSSSTAPLTLKDLWKKIISSTGSLQNNAEIVVDFASDKMNTAWENLEKAPEGTVKSRVHGVGLKLLSRVKPSEILFKSISKDVTRVDITYPASFHPRIVRRRLRLVALRGSIVHRRYFYASLTLLPFSCALSVLPLPNVPFFWVLFRVYSHWRALQGSERLLALVSDCSWSRSSLISEKTGINFGNTTTSQVPWDLQPSEELGKLLVGIKEDDGLSNCALSKICLQYHLDMTNVLKYKTSL